LSTARKRPSEEEISEFHPADKEGHEKEYTLFEQLTSQMTDLIIDEGTYVHKQPRRIFISLRPGKLRDVVQFMQNNYDMWQFSTMTGRDLGDDLQVNYHFFLNDAKIAITFRLNIPRSKPEYDSITDLVPAAEFIENEVNDLLGIVPQGHPKPRRMELPEDWPEGQYPLRKDWSDPEDLMEQSKTTGPKPKEEL
jgi:Ni,Fe-hydrogenase III component G